MSHMLALWTLQDFLNILLILSHGNMLFDRLGHF